MALKSLQKLQSYILSHIQIQQSYALFSKDYCIVNKNHQSSIDCWLVSF